MIALIPARVGSKRCPGKNTRLLNEQPLITYSIVAAAMSGVFERLIVASDDQGLLASVMDWNDVRILAHLREPVSDHQADIEWIREVMLRTTPRPDSFAILRPTSPFRTAATIQRAYKQFRAMADCGDSIRAVEPVKQHPGKMWEWAGNGYPMTPLLSGKRSDGVPWHSCPTQTLPTFYVQNSSLEMAWTANIEVHGTIHGRKVAPFFTEGYEGFSIDTEEDWEKAVVIAREHPELLPKV